MIRTIDEYVHSYNNPVSQVWNQTFHLKALLKKYSIPPIYPFVTFTNSHSIIEVESNYMRAKKYIIRSAMIRSIISSLIEKSQMEVFTKKEMNR